MGHSANGSCGYSVGSALFTLHLLPARELPRGLLQVTQIGIDFSLLHYKKWQHTATSNFHKHAHQSAGLACVWWAEVMQYITVVMQLNECICNSNIERQSYKFLWFSVPQGLKSFLTIQIGRLKAGRSRHGFHTLLLFYICPFTWGLLGLPASPKHICQQPMLWYMEIPPGVD